jgi:hypothetical protein
LIALERSPMISKPRVDLLVMTPLHAAYMRRRERDIERRQAKFVTNNIRG